MGDDILSPYKAVVLPVFGAPSSMFSTSQEGGSKSKDTERANQKACDDVATVL